VVDFVGYPEARSESGVVVELFGNAIALPLADPAQVGSFRQILTDESVGVLCSSARKIRRASSLKPARVNCY
jgi:hypothetical protein